MRSIASVDLPVAFEATLKYAHLDELDVEKEADSLAFIIPTISEDRLRELASREMNGYNETTADLRWNSMFLSWSARNLEVRVDGWMVPGFPYGECGAEGELRVMFFSGDLAALSTHVFPADEWEALLCGLQGQGGCSGPNWHCKQAGVDAKLFQTTSDEAGVHNVWTAQVAKKGQASHCAFSRKLGREQSCS